MEIAENSTANSKSKLTSSRNLWISGLSSITRAGDLKSIFSKYGKVIGAKVVTNTKTPGTRCYGYITMSTSNEATRCIQHLHCTELHGRIISVERTKNEVNPSSTSSSSRKSDTKKSDAPNSKTSEPKTTDSSTDKSKDTVSADANEKSKETAGSKIESKDKSKSRSRRSSSRGGRSQNRKDKSDSKMNVLSYERIREERDRQRLRDRERALREEERRRNDIRRRQREEEQRLIREREKLAIEREKIEKEKAELLRMERERQKLERERIELEKMELKRQQMKILSSSNDSKRMKRVADDRYADTSIDRKRRTDRRIEAPPPPRFDASIDSSYDKKRDNLSSKRTDYNSMAQKDDYMSIKRNDYSNINKRDDFNKREQDPINRHSSYNRDDKPSNRYDQSSYRSNRSNNIDDTRNMSISNNKRYDMPDPYDRNSSMNSVGNWQSSHNVSSHTGGQPLHSHGSTMSTIKSFIGNGMQTGSSGSISWPNKISDDSHWGRNPPESSDRYDRTYNERSNNGSYIDNSRQGNFTNMMSSVSGGNRSLADRYSSSIQRYDSGKY